jgi:tetratricopeptide (TPR) repeat protein
MDQLVVLQEIYASFSKGGDGLQKINSKAIEGSCPELIRKMVESSKKGRIDEEVCRKLVNCLQDVYEIKRLGDVCRKAGLHCLAIESYNKALSLSRDKTLRSVLQNNLGQAYALQGDLAKSTFCYQKAARSFESAGDSIGLAHVLGNMGSAYRRARNWDQAVEHCYRSLKIFEEKGDELGASQMTGGLGRIYAEMGERELAARYFERSLTEFQRLGDKKSAAWVQDRLGRIASERKDWDKALCYFNQSYSLFDQQGQSHSAGIVLSNLGRTYLDMGEATIACESLERAVRLIPRNMHPNYQNALSGLAATYNTLGRERLREAIDAGANNSSDRSTRSAASKYFARAADQYLELASSLSVGSPEIKAAAGIAKSRSYITKLSGKVSDEEAVALADRALLALDTAAANSNEQKKTLIESLKTILTGMKEAWSIGLLESEPWRLCKAVTNASEHLIEGARGVAAGNTNDYLCDALHNLGASMEANGARSHPADNLNAAASYLRKAKEQPLSGKDENGRLNSQRMIEAAEILEVLANKEKGQDLDESAPLPKNQLNLRPERDALLLIGWTLADNALSLVDDTDIIYTWDDALNVVHNPVANSYLGTVEIFERKAEPMHQVIPKTDRTVLEISNERVKARDLVLADGTIEASEAFVSDMANTQDCWLLPVNSGVACKSQTQICSMQERPRWKTEIIEPPMRGVNNEDTTKIISDRAINEKHPTASPEDAGARVGETVNYPNHPGPSTASKQSQKGLFSSQNAILLLKGMTLVVVLLLAIEAILYLI